MISNFSSKSSTSCFSRVTSDWSRGPQEGHVTLLLLLRPPPPSWLEFRLLVSPAVLCRYQFLTPVFVEPLTPLSPELYRLLARNEVRMRSTTVFIRNYDQHVLHLKTTKIINKFMEFCSLQIHSALNSCEFKLVPL